jgi:hypothetical protein
MTPNSTERTTRIKLFISGAAGILAATPSLVFGPGLVAAFRTLVVAGDGRSLFGVYWFASYSGTLILLLGGAGRCFSSGSVRGPRRLVWGLLVLNGIVHGCCSFSLWAVREGFMVYGLAP